MYIPCFGIYIPCFGIYIPRLGIKKLSISFPLFSEVLLVSKAGMQIDTVNSLESLVKNPLIEVFVSLLNNVSLWGKII